KQETAADAVRTLSAKEPSKTHICMRARTGRGHWSKPNCDSSWAGINADGKTFGAPFTALNFASYGLSGLGAAALVETSGDPEWLPAEPVVPDSANIYIGDHVEDGSPDPRALAGFRISIGKGELYNFGYSLVGKDKLDTSGALDKPRPENLFVGSQEKGHPLNGFALIPSGS
ncbi:hydrolase, partial [Streptomyces sp. SID11233]|nr:hydrolase [Streptomyces sp. SID11233]